MLVWLPADTGFTQCIYPTRFKRKWRRLLTFRAWWRGSTDGRSRPPFHGKDPFSPASRGDSHPGALQRDDCAGRRRHAAVVIEQPAQNTDMGGLAWASARCPGRRLLREWPAGSFNRCFGYCSLTFRNGYLLENHFSKEIKCGLCFLDIRIWLSNMSSFVRCERTYRGSVAASFISDFTHFGPLSLFLEQSG